MLIRVFFFLPPPQVHPSRTSPWTHLAGKHQFISLGSHHGSFSNTKTRHRWWEQHARRGKWCFGATTSCFSWTCQCRYRNLCDGVKWQLRELEKKRKNSQSKPEVLKTTATIWWFITVQQLDRNGRNVQTRLVSTFTFLKPFPPNFPQCEMYVCIVLCMNSCCLSIFLNFASRYSLISTSFWLLWLIQHKSFETTDLTSRTMET